MKKRIPYGISDYKMLMDKNYLYIDKTPFIEKIENYHSPYLFFLRPRRFGKSLFTSVLISYYDIKEKANFQRLFSETYIGKNSTPERNSFCVLDFTFTGLDTSDEDILKENFLSKTTQSFEKFIKKYNLNVNLDKTLKEPAMLLNSFMESIRAEITHPIYVIIDEYDHFANELLSFQTELFSDIVSKTGFVRKWYEIIKEWTKEDGMVRRIFATGVSPITLDSLTSGFNIASDITRHQNFNEMMGFTKDEVIEIIEKSVSKALNEDELAELIKTLQKNYNGYLFSEGSKNRLFNSDMILYYMQSLVEVGVGPKSLIDKNIASDYGKLGKMFELKNKNENFKVLDAILKGENVKCRITEGFSLEKDFSKDDFKSLLFYLGMLTIDKSVLDRVILKVPNYAIKGLYFNYFMKKLNEALDYELDTTEIEEAIAEIALEGNNNSLVSIVEKTLNKVSNRDFIKFDEKYVKLIFLTYCFLSKIYLVKSEYEVNDGYIDIALLKQANMEPTYFAIFELKYISKAQYEKDGENIVKEKTEEAIKQIKEYSKSEELMGLPNLKKWAIVFVNDKCVVNMEIPQ